MSCVTTFSRLFAVPWTVSRNVEMSSRWKYTAWHKFEANVPKANTTIAFPWFTLQVCLPCHADTIFSSSPTAASSDYTYNPYGIVSVQETWQIQESFLEGMDVQKSSEFPRKNRPFHKADGVDKKSCFVHMGFSFLSKSAQQSTTVKYLLWIAPEACWGSIGHHV